MNGRQINEIGSSPVLIIVGIRIIHSRQRVNDSSLVDGAPIDVILIGHSRQGICRLPESDTY